MTYSIYTDGGSRGNPGLAAIGFVIFNEDKLVDFGGECIGIATNNVAEYTALYKGLITALKNGIDSLNCYMDSELIVKQLKGEYKVKNDDMIVLNKKVKDIISKFNSFEIFHVERSKNSFADKLVNIALDSASN